MQGVGVMKHLDVSAFYLAAAEGGPQGSSPQLQIVDGAMVSFYVSLMLLRLFWEEARSYRSWIGPW